MMRFVVVLGARGGRLAGRGRLAGPGGCRFYSQDNGPKRQDRGKKDPDWIDRMEAVRVRMALVAEWAARNFLTLTALLVAAWYLVKSASVEITFDEALRRINTSDLESLHVDQRTNQGHTVKTVVHLQTKEGRLWSESLDENMLMRSVLRFKKRLSSEESAKATWRITQRQTTQAVADQTLGFLGFLGLLSFLLIPALMSRRNSQGLAGRPEVRLNYKVKRFNKDNNVKTRFKDIAGIAQTKQEVEEFVDFLKNPQKYKEVGAKLPKGALLSGPPGTGKTLLAKAVAGEAGVPFFFASGSEFVEMYVGLGASRIRELFEEAKKSSAAIIFIDEIDAIGKKRAGKLSSNAEGDATLNQLLVEMDGFNSSNNVVVIAATNRKDLLDPALVRPGRFDRTIDINTPDISARAEIFAVHLKPLKLNNESERSRFAKRLAALTPGFSGADIANVCNEAAIHAVRRGKDAVEDHDFEMAVERVIGGLPMTKAPSAEERRTVAVHESGHGVVSWYLKGASPLLKLTIIPRSKGALGFAQYLPNEIPLQSEEYLRNQIISILAGRAAEREFFGRVSTGAYDDLQKAYRIARAIVTKLGMNGAVGQAVFVENDYGVKEYSDGQNRAIDEQVALIIKECSRTAAEMVKEHREKIARMSEELLARETLDLRAIQAILGERPFPTEKVFEAYLEEVSVKSSPE